MKRHRIRTKPYEVPIPMDTSIILVHRPMSNFLWLFVACPNIAYNACLQRLLRFREITDIFRFVNVVAIDNVIGGYP
jgi:hypothetical protein